MTSASVNPDLTGFRCIGCDAIHPVGDYFEGCPACAAAGRPVNVAAVYRNDTGWTADPGANSFRRYARRLPILDWPSLGEGDTPCVEVARLADELGTGRLFLKCEDRNPTGSHKDRMSMLAVARAALVGAERIILASSGNAGVSAAAYAGLNGLECEVVTTPKMNPVWRRAIEFCGARLTFVEDSHARWSYMRDQSKRGAAYPVTNYMLPAVGSSPYGVEGLKTIAYELAQDLPDGIDAVVVPTSRGDILAGLLYGFEDLVAAGHLGRIPALYAVEPFARISRVLRGEDVTSNVPGSTPLASIAGDTVTVQAVRAVERSGGGAVPVEWARVAEDQRGLARLGIYLENSSAAALTGLRALLAAGQIGRDATVVLLATSHGFKEMPN